ncbi:hypothetical protein HMPREF1987_01666 [Peptostreptococcaceae bacterium oral taxon 113 str. W5053]|nr:hypothetical protein HMPREF1987_01666 [Peptostreptococcaceae bacterium oral taxon 113 str. W5053]
MLAIQRYTVLYIPVYLTLTGNELQVVIVGLSVNFAIAGNPDILKNMLKNAERSQ